MDREAVLREILLWHGMKGAHNVTGISEKLWLSTAHSCWMDTGG